MKRTQRCFDLLSLEQERLSRADIKRCRTDSEQTDFSMDSDLSDISEKFENSASLTPRKEDTLELTTIRCQLSFPAEELNVNRRVFGRTALDRVIRQETLENQ